MATDRQARVPRAIRQQSATQTLPANLGVGCYLPQGVEENGVSDGIRTRDVQIHSLALYQAELRSPHA